MTDPARYRLPGRRGWWRDLFTLIGIGATAEFLLDLSGWDPSWWVLIPAGIVIVILAAALGLLSEPPRRTEDQW